MLKKITCVVLVIMMIFLTGCWNNSSITKLSIVVGMGIDKAPDGGIDYTVQLYNPSNSSSSQSGSGSPKSSGSTVTITSKGETPFDAVRNILSYEGKKPLYSMAQVMVIGEDAAKEGLDEIWDLWERNHEISNDVRIIVVKNGTARSVLEAYAELSQIGAVEVAEAVDNKAYGKNVKSMSFEVSRLLGQPYAGIVTGCIDPSGAPELKKMKVEGGAVFKNAKLEGYLNKDETRGYLFAKNQITSTILVVQNPKEPGKLVTFEVFRSKSKLTAEMVDGKPKLGIEITTRGAFGDEQGSADLTGPKEIDSLELEAEDLITENVKAAITKSQKMFQCDILNFSDELYGHHYDKFEKTKGNWDELYSDADISVKVDFSIDNSATMKKPAFKR